LRAHLSVVMLMTLSVSACVETKKEDPPTPKPNHSIGYWVGKLNKGLDDGCKYQVQFSSGAELLNSFGVPYVNGVAKAVEQICKFVKSPASKGGKPFRINGVLIQGHPK